jgi:hypothetical protein
MIYKPISGGEYTKELKEFLITYKDAPKIA